MAVMGILPGANLAVTMGRVAPLLSSGGTAALLR